MSHWNRRRPQPEQRDANEPEISAALEAVGASVYKVSGKRIPDLLVGYRGETFLLEVKNPAVNRPAAAIGKRATQPGGEWEGYDQALRKSQAEFFRDWKGKPAVIVRTVHEALTAIGAPCSCSTCAAVAEADAVLAGPVPGDTTGASQHRFGTLVRAARVAADKSLREVARALGISHVKLAEIERGKREPLDIGEWEQLRKVIPGLSKVEVWAAFEQYYAWADELDDVVRQDAALPRDP